MRGRKPNPPHLRPVTGGTYQLPAASAEGGGQGVKNEIPDCPEIVAANPVAKAEWDLITEQAHEAGLCAKLYKATLATYAITWARWVLVETALAELVAEQMEAAGDDESRTVAGIGAFLVNTPNGFPVQSPAYQIAKGTIEQLNKIAAELGFTPTSLTRALRGDPAQGTLFPQDAMEEVLHRGKPRPAS